MSDIDEIALETVKAIGNIDPDKLPGGRTQAIAQAQILVRDAIEKQLEQAEAKADLFRQACEDLLDDRPIEQAFILRKQAEAVNYCISFLGGVNMVRDMDLYAQSLRQQADEIEND